MVLPHLIQTLRHNERLRNTHAMVESEGSSTSTLRMPEGQKIYGNWSVVEIDGNETLETARPQLVFGEDGRVSGSTGLNRLFASFSFRDQEFELGQAATTRMAGFRGHGAESLLSRP